MVTTCSNELSQGLAPIPSIRQHIEFTRNRQLETSDNLFNQGDFGLEGAASFGSPGMVEFGPERQKEVLVEQGRENPLVAEDMRLSSMVFMPGTSGHLFACFFGNRIIHDKKEDRTLLNPKRLEELVQSGLGDLFHGPDIFSEESGKARNRSVKKWIAETVDHGGSVSFFAQLDEADDEG